MNSLGISLPLKPHYAARLLVRTLKSGNFGHAGRPGVVGGSGAAHSARVQRALASHRPITMAARKKAADSERVIANATGGADLPDNEPMDVVIKTSHRTVGVEVKTVVIGIHSKLTCHPDSRRRKEQWVKSHHAEGHTVAVDKRGATPVYYHRAGFGAFYLHTMDKVSLQQLVQILK